MHDPLALLQMTIDNNKESAVETVNRYQIFDRSYKWVGAVTGDDGNIYCIPTGATSILKIDSSEQVFTQLGELSQGNFKYTAGALWKKDGNIYGFPRRANTLLQIDVKNQKVKEIPLHTNYDESVDHHYSGGLYENVLYLPPRNANHILAIDLQTYETREIGNSQILDKYSYCGTTVHYNGLLYFHPQKNSQVMVFNPKTEEIAFIGEKISTMSFGSAISANGSIYGFSCYSTGIMKIDIMANTVEILCETEVPSAFFGTKLASNGKLYSIPGLTNEIYELDPTTDQVRLVYTLDDIKQEDFTDALCAGGALTKDGSLWMIPAYGDSIFEIRFTNIVKTFDDKILQWPQLNNY